MTVGYTLHMTTQIAVKLPEGLLSELDRLVGSGVYANRSQAVRAGLQAVVDNERSRAAERAYGEGFGRFPETEAELADATRLALEAISDEPWERWW